MAKGRSGGGKGPGKGAMTGKAAARVQAAEAKANGGQTPREVSQPALSVLQPRTVADTRISENQLFDMERRLSAVSLHQ